MKVVLAPDKFKGSLTAVEVCEAMTSGIHDFNPEIEVISHPLADGGEGTSELLEEALGLKKVFIKVNDPLFRPVFTHYLMNERVAFVEMANASGLQLLTDQERNPLNTTTFGTGEMIENALDQGVSEVYLMIGGSATSDGGIGMANALGYGFGVKPGTSFISTGKGLNDITSVFTDELHHRVKDVKFTVLCDVQNPLLGPNGAAAVYGPQKGADTQAVTELESGLRKLSELLKNGYENSPGAGAAGGLGYGAMSFLAAELKPGIDTVMDITGFDQKLNDVDLVITGEGKMDLQTVEGKVIAGISSRVLKRDMPFSVICGVVENRDIVQERIEAHSIYPLVNEEVSTGRAMREAKALVRKRAFELMRDFSAGR